jgi:tRNA (guanine37-N1)-methyltransferase
MRFDIITIFPSIFDSYFNESLFRRARTKKLVDIRVHNLRDFALDRHKKVDDRAFGGGPGMVLKIEPIYRAIDALRRPTRAKKRERVILFSARGRRFDAKTAKRLAHYDRLILICGRYEGVDERVARYIADEEISIGNYVLSGGELPAMVLVEAVSRFIPGFLGKYESLEDVKGSYPVYTRPPAFVPAKGKGAWTVPPVLLSGDHQKIARWRRQP